MSKIETNPHRMILGTRHDELLEKEAALAEVTKQRDVAVGLLKANHLLLSTVIGKRAQAVMRERLAAFLANLENADE